MDKKLNIESLLSEDLAVWFGKKKKPKGSKQPKGPWVNICKNKKGGGHPPCGRKDEDGDGKKDGAYPKCRAAGVAAKMSAKDKKKACSQKRRAEKKDKKTGKGNKPTMVSNKNLKKEGELQYTILENNNSKPLISEELQYHFNKEISLTETIFRYGSPKYFDVINEARELYTEGFGEWSDEEIEILESDRGKFFIYEGERLPFDFPMITESEYQGKDIDLNKPKSGGSKKWYVYVKDPKTGKVKKISYGSPDMSAKWNDPGARKSFAARHRCAEKKDKTKAGYWACRAHKDFGTNVSGRFW